MWKIMEVKICLIIVCILCGGLMSPTLAMGGGQPTLELTWEKVIETPYGHVPPSQFLVTSDGSYVITGSYLDKHNIGIPYLLKVDSEGNYLWNYTYSHPLKPHGKFRSMIQTSDGGYALTGCIYPEQSEEYATWDLCVVKIDENGLEEWNRTINGQSNNFDYGSQILTTQDGYLISGCTGKVTNWAIDYWLIKLDEEGNEEWNKTYHRFSSDQATSFVPLKDGNYLLGGISRKTSSSSSHHEIWIIKIHGNGTEIWDRVYSNTKYALASWEKGLIATRDGGFLLAAYPWTTQYNWGKDYWIIKCNDEGEVEWEKIIGSDDYDTPRICLQDAAGDFYIGGSFESSTSNYDAGDFCLTKLSNSGELLWQQQHGDPVAGEIIQDMKLVDGNNSTDSIIACGLTVLDGDPSTLNCWLGRYDTDTYTDQPSNSPGIIFFSFSLAIIVLFRKKVN